MDEETIYKVLRLLITTRNLAKIKKACVDTLGLTAEQTAETIEAASGMIAEAAVWNRDIEAGKALLRIDDLFERSLNVQDTKTALAAERERMKLLGLHRPKPETEMDERDGERETIIREHLEPLALAPPGTAAEELLRLAALKIIQSKEDF